MNLKKIGAATAGALLFAGGGTVVADNQINPYTEDATKYEIAAESTLPEGGLVKTELAKDRPAITLSKWNGEAPMTVSYDNVKAPGSRAFLTERMEWKGATEEVHAYPIAKGQQNDDGGFEIEIILNQQPDTNTFDFSIDGANNLDFLYQGPLSNDVSLGEEGIVSCTDTQCFDKDHKIVGSRPANVVGSYAVFYKGHTNHIEGQTNYATGKAYHIYRPKAVDAHGSEQWADLTYSKGTLTVTVPQSYLDTAAYPVTVDPTFGYTTIGASTLNAGLAGCLFTPTENGTITTMTHYGSSAVSTLTLGLAIYSDSAGLPNAKLASDSNTTTLTTTPQWLTNNVSYTFTASTPYWLAWWDDANSHNYYYDAGSATQRSFYNGTPSFETWPASWINGGTSARKVSIYATYTAATAAATFSPWQFSDY